MLSIQSFAESDKGLVRSENEDSLLLYIPEDKAILEQKGILAIVADGVGGAAAGKLASETAVEVIKESYYKDSQNHSLQDSLRIANLEIYVAAQKDQRYRGMATTCTALVIKGKEGFISHVGDSRAYLFRRGKLTQITEDHTLVGKLLKDGVISLQEALNHPQRNVILKALGSSSNVEPDTYQIRLEKGDCVLLCSDGLHGLVTDTEITNILENNPVEESGKELINLAKERGGTDNITVLILCLKERRPLKDTKPIDTGPFETQEAKGNRIFIFLIVLLFFILVGVFFYRFTNEQGKTPPSFEKIITIN